MIDSKKDGTGNRKLGLISVIFFVVVIFLISTHLAVASSGSSSDPTDQCVEQIMEEILGDTLTEAREEITNTSEKMNEIIQSAREPLEDTEKLLDEFTEFIENADLDYLVLKAVEKIDDEYNGDRLNEIIETVEAQIGETLNDIEVNIDEEDYEDAIEGLELIDEVTDDPEEFLEDEVISNFTENLDDTEFVSDFKDNITAAKNELEDEVDELRDDIWKSLGVTEIEDSINDEIDNFEDEVYNVTHNILELVFNLTEDNNNPTGNIIAGHGLESSGNVGTLDENNGGISERWQELTNYTSEAYEEISEEIEEEIIDNVEDVADDLDDETEVIEWMENVEREHIECCAEDIATDFIGRSVERGLEVIDSRIEDLVDSEYVEDVKNCISNEISNIDDFDQYEDLDDVTEDLRDIVIDCLENNVLEIIDNKLEGIDLDDITELQYIMDYIWEEVIDEAIPDDDLAESIYENFEEKVLNEIEDIIAEETCNDELAEDITDIVRDGDSWAELKQAIEGIDLNDITCTGVEDPEEVIEDIWHEIEQEILDSKETLQKIIAESIAEAVIDSQVGNFFIDGFDLTGILEGQIKEIIYERLEDNELFLYMEEIYEFVDDLEEDGELSDYVEDILMDHVSELIDLIEMTDEADELVDAIETVADVAQTIEEFRDGIDSEYIGNRIVDLMDNIDTFDDVDETLDDMRDWILDMEEDARQILDTANENIDHAEKINDFLDAIDGTFERIENAIEKVCEIDIEDEVRQRGLRSAAGQVSDAVDYILEEVPAPLGEFVGGHTDYEEGSTIISDITGVISDILDFLTVSLNDLLGDILDFLMDWVHDQLQDILEEIIIDVVQDEILPELVDSVVEYLVFDDVEDVSMEISRENLTDAILNASKEVLLERAEDWLADRIEEQVASEVVESIENEAWDELLDIGKEEAKEYLMDYVGDEVKYAAAGLLVATVVDEELIDTIQDDLKDIGKYMALSYLMTEVNERYGDDIDYLYNCIDDCMENGEVTPEVSIETIEVTEWDQDPPNYDFVVEYTGDFEGFNWTLLDNESDVIEKYYDDETVYHIFDDEYHGETVDIVVEGKYDCDPEYDTETKSLEVPETTEEEFYLHVDYMMGEGGTYVDFLDNGSIQVPNWEPEDGPLQKGEDIAIEAVPEDGYEFFGWGDGNCSGVAEKVCEINNVDSDIYVEKYFIEQ